MLKRLFEKLFRGGRYSAPALRDAVDNGLPMDDIGRAAEHSRGSTAVEHQLSQPNRKTPGVLGAQTVLHDRGNALRHRPVRFEIEGVSNTKPKKLDTPMSLKILIAGATGGTGKILTKKIKEAGQTPIALVRDSSDTSDLPLGTHLRHGDLTGLPDTVCDGVDVVVFAAGSGGGTSAEMTDKIDRDGAKDLIARAADSGVKRFVMLSSFGADTPEPEGDLAHYLKAKHEADTALIMANVTHAILRPVALSDDAEVGDFIFGEAVDPNGKATRADVAQVLAEAAIHGTLDGQAVNMQSGRK